MSMTRRSRVLSLYDFFSLVWSPYRSIMIFASLTQSLRKHGLGMKLRIHVPLCYLSEIVGEDICVRGNSSHTTRHISAWNTIEKHNTN